MGIYLRSRGDAPIKRYQGLCQDVQIGRIGPNVVENVSRDVGERGLRTFPSFSDPVLDPFLFPMEVGKPRFLLLLINRSGVVGNKFWANQSGYVVPDAVNTP